jgi:hypothetical protein
MGYVESSYDSYRVFPSQQLAMYHHCTVVVYEDGIV